MDELLSQALHQTIEAENIARHEIIVVLVGRESTKQLSRKHEQFCYSMKAGGLCHGFSKSTMQHESKSKYHIETISVYPTKRCCIIHLQVHSNNSDLHFTFFLTSISSLDNTAVKKLILYSLMNLYHKVYLHVSYLTNSAVLGHHVLCNNLPRELFLNHSPSTLTHLHRHPSVTKKLIY